MKNIKLDNQIMTLLGVSEIRRMICDTDKGYLKLFIRKGEDKYHLVLDAVPLPKELNKELMDILFPIHISPSMNTTVSTPGLVTSVTTGTPLVVKPKPKGGRPAGSKNK